MSNTKFISLTLGLAAGISISIAASQPIQAADIVYNPPSDITEWKNANRSRGVSRGVSRGSSRGVSRGACQSISKDFSLRVLVPGIGNTISEQPTLYWSISQALSAQFELTLKPIMPPGSFDFPEPLIDKTLHLSVNKGIQALSLVQHNAKLDINTQYEWSISLVCDSENPSINIFDSGTIKRVEPSNFLNGRIKGANERQLPYIYAENGVWYDALDTLSRLIQKDDNSLSTVRASLLKQGGLSDVDI
ncbi:MAG: hypothetical protein DRQ49_01635 [Gammaproteobacteria bacterium]|nr:MAG: hypothetical protein DRQ49_01635 [Gammaproteobacteria bacterium]